MDYTNIMKKTIFETQNLNELAYNEIMKRIISREYTPGQRLVDSQLAEDFGISRTPIRDAMRKLTEDGLLINTSARGFYVFRPTAKDVEEIFELSEMIEYTAAKKNYSSAFRQRLCGNGGKAGYSRRKGKQHILHGSRRRIQTIPD